jgi:hypothetical protein
MGNPDQQVLISKNFTLARSFSMKLPKTLGETIDLLFTLREERKAIEAQAKEVAEKERILEAHLMSNFDKAGLDGAKGRRATAAIKRTTVADVTDWEAYFKYISKTKSWDLVQKRASITALRERWADGKVVPGVEAKEIESLSLTKVS